MKELSFEQMERIDGGLSSDCGWAIATAVVSAAAIAGVTILAPEVWLLPKTWWGAATLVAGNLYNLDSSC
jgi:hypothetical protein